MDEAEACRLAIEAGRKAEAERERTRQERARRLPGGAIRNTADGSDEPLAGRVPRQRGSPRR